MGRALAIENRRESACLRAAALLLALSALLAGCASTPRPAPVDGFPKEPERLLIFVPGVLGSKLEAPSGRSVWGSGTDVIWPRDGGYEMALPIVDREADDTLVAGIVDSVRLGPLYRRRVYDRLLDWFVERGYRVGDLEGDLSAGAATLFPFAYDFRRSNGAAVEELRDQLEALRAARGEEPLDFDLLCQSNGAYLCRLLVARESRRSDGLPPLLPTRIGFVGTANGGGLRTLRELRDGRIYVPTLGIGRHFQAEVIFSFESVFLDLPHAARIQPRGAEPIFFDERGEPLAIDLYDAQEWVTHGWTAFAPDARRRLARSRASGIFGTESDRVLYLQGALREAAQLQEELMKGPASLEPAPQLFMVQASHVPTIQGAVVRRRDDGEVETVFHGDKAAEELSDAARGRLTQPGDEHATIPSQQWLSPEETSWLVAPTMEVEGGHFDMILLPEVLDRLAEFFLGDIFRGDIFLGDGDER